MLQKKVSFSPTAAVHYLVLKASQELSQITIVNSNQILITDLQNRPIDKAFPFTSIIQSNPVPTFVEQQFQNLYKKNKNVLIVNSGLSDQGRSQFLLGESQKSLIKRNQIKSQSKGLLFNVGDHVTRYWEKVSFSVLQIQQEQFKDLLNKQDKEIQKSIHYSKNPITSQHQVAFYTILSLKNRERRSQSKALKQKAVLYLFTMENHNGGQLCIGILDYKLNPVSKQLYQIFDIASNHIQPNSKIIQALTAINMGLLEDESKKIMLYHMSYSSDMSNNIHLLQSVRKIFNDQFNENGQSKTQKFIAQLNQFMTEIKDEIETESKNFKEKIKAIQSFMGNQIELQKILQKNNKTEIENLKKQKEAIESIELFSKANLQFQNKIQIIKNQIEAINRQDSLTNQRHITEVLKLKHAISKAHQKLNIILKNKSFIKRSQEEEIGRLMQSRKVKQATINLRISRNPIILNSMSVMNSGSQSRGDQHQIIQICKSHQKITEKIKEENSKLSQKISQKYMLRNKKISSKIQMLQRDNQSLAMFIVHIYQKYKKLCNSYGQTKIKPIPWNSQKSKELFQFLDNFVLQKIKNQPLKLLQPTKMQSPQELTDQQLLNHAEKLIEDLQKQHQRGGILQQRIRKIRSNFKDDLFSLRISQHTKS